jgi:hypothetical protein
MQQFLLLLSSGLLFASSAQAQFGLRAGGNSSRFPEVGSGRANPGVVYAGAQSSSKLGYQLGVYYAQKLSPRLSLVPEVQLSREQVQVTAFNHSLPDALYDSDYTVHTTYLNVPVLLRWKLGPVYVEAGPQASLLLGGREIGTVAVTSVGWGGYREDFDQKATDRYRRFDVGPCLGVGVQLPAGLGLSLRAYQGLLALTSATEVTYQTGTYVSGQRRQSVQASLTYQLTARQ